MTTTTLNPGTQSETKMVNSNFYPVYKHEPVLFTLSAVFSGFCWLLLVVGTLGIGLVYVGFGFLIYLFAHSALISYVRGTGARLCDAQYPELHRIVRECSARIGMEAPEVFLMHGDGIFNAFATRFLGRNFVVLYSDIVDALESNPAAVRFYVGHELGHIHRGHLKWMSFLLPARLIPFLGAAYSRSCEYTADRFGHMCCSLPEDSVLALSVLAVGGKKAPLLNVDRYMDQLAHSSGFFMSFHEYLSPYPWLTKRIAAVKSYGRGSEPTPPGRSKIAFLFAMSGGSGLLVLMIALVFVGIAFASNPKLKKYLSTIMMSSSLATSESIADSGDDEDDSGSEQTFSATEKLKALTDSIASLDGVKGSIAAFALKNGDWPEDNVAAGVSKSDPAYGPHVDYVHVSEGYIYVYYKYSSPLQGAVVTLTSEFDKTAAGGISWGCSTDSIEAAALPAGCVIEKS